MLLTLNVYEGSMNIHEGSMKVVWYMKVVCTCIYMVHEGRRMLFSLNAILVLKLDNTAASKLNISLNIIKLSVATSQLSNSLHFPMHLSQDRVVYG